MKKLLFIVTLFLSFSVFAQPNPVDEYLAWEAETNKKANSGEITWTAYFEQAYLKVGELPPHPYRTLKMQLFSEVIPLARKLDAKQISVGQYTDEVRIIYTRLNTEYEQKLAQWNAQQEEAERQRQAAIQQRIYQQQQYLQQQQALEQQRNQQQMNMGLQLLNMGRPQMQPAPNLFGTQCQTRYNGGVAYTNCN